MKRILKVVLFAPFILIFLIVTFLSVKYSPVYGYRLITMNVPDVCDYQYFHNRIIKGSENTNIFAVQQNKKYVESLFSERVSVSGFNSFDEWAVNSQTTALIFIRRDAVLYESYFNGFNGDSYFHSQSMAKSIISFLIGAASDEGLAQSANDPTTMYLPELTERDPCFEKITIKDLPEMRSGLEYNTSHIPGKLWVF